MVARGELPEPTSAAHLAKLEPLKRIGGKMSKEACQDPEKAKYIGECCSGTRMWGDLGADIYVDDKGKQWAVFCCGACKAPLPWLPLPPLAAPSPPVTLTLAQKEMIEEKRQVALARKRAREERVVSSSPPCGPGRPTAHVPRPCLTGCCPCVMWQTLVSITDWAENGSLVQQGYEKREHWASPTD